MVIQPDLQRLDCQIVEVLPFDTEFEIIFDVLISKSLSEPVKMTYHTAKQFEIHDIVLEQATQLCIYTTTSINYTGSGVSTNPKSITRNIGYNTDIYEQRGNESIRRKTCPEKSGQVVNVAEVRLDGKTKYDFHFDTNLKDMYGTSLKVPYAKK